jgi:hypothetical protein
MFGIAGIFIDPLIASLFVTILEPYGLSFSDYLPEVHYGKARDVVNDVESSSESER